jgi:hypothetical protein
MTATCGANSNQGNQAERKTTFFSIINRESARVLQSYFAIKIIAARACCMRLVAIIYSKSALVGLLETLQQVIAAFDDGIQCFFGALFASPDLLKFFVFHGANLHVIAQADAA